MGDVWVGVVWACILILVWLRGKIRVGEWCCEVVGSCEVQLSCEVRCSASSQSDKNLYVCVCESVRLCVGQSLYAFPLFAEKPKLLFRNCCNLVRICYSELWNEFYFVEL